MRFTILQLNQQTLERTGKPLTRGVCTRRNLAIIFYYLDYLDCKKKLFDVLNNSSNTLNFYTFPDKLLAWFYIANANFTCDTYFLYYLVSYST